MTIRDALADFFERRGIKPRDESIDDWLREKWAYTAIAGRRIPIKPLYGYKKVVILHDVHHLVAGYDTSLRGEFEVAAWELGSGGCGPYLLMWNNRILAFLMGLVVAPARTLRAFRRGRKQRNVYRFDCQTLLGRDLEDIRRWVGGASGATGP